MRLPGFTAGLVLHDRVNKYEGAAARADGEGAGRLVPQMMMSESECTICDVYFFCTRFRCGYILYNCERLPC